MHEDEYGLNSKFTYWPKKHITTETRFSLKRKLIYIKMNDTGSKSIFFFSGKLGKSKSRFYAKIGNDLVKYGMNLNGELNMKTKKVLINVTTEPFGKLVTFEAYARRNALENGFHMRLSLANASSYVTGYLGSYYPKKELRLRFNGVFMKEPFLLRTSYYVRSSTGRLLESVAQGFGNSANASLEYEYSLKRWSKNYLQLSGALNDKMIKTGVLLKQSGVRAYFEMNGQTKNRKIVEADVEYVRGDEETALKCSISGLGHTTSLVWSYYNHASNETGLKMIAQVSNKKGYSRRMQLQTGLFTLEDEMGLRVMANVLDKEFEAKWSILSGNRSGLRFVAMYMKKELSLQSTWMNYNNSKELRLDATYNGTTISLINTYRAKDKHLCSEIAGLFPNRFRTCLKFEYGNWFFGFKYLYNMSEAVGTKAAVTAAWKHNAEEFLAGLGSANSNMEQSLGTGTGLGSRISRDGIQSYFGAGAVLPKKPIAMVIGWESNGIILRTWTNEGITSDFFVGFETHSAYSGLRFRGVVKEKSVDVLLKYEKNLSLDLRVQRKLVTFESMRFRNRVLQGVGINVTYEGNQVGSFFAILNNKSSSKVFQIGGGVMNYSAEYQLSMKTSKLESQVSSMVIVNVSSTSYKYGYSVSHHNLGTSGQTNHVFTTKLQYAKDKNLTSTYQFLKSEQHVNLMSKMELVPGQFIVNKIAYDKTERKLSMKHELLPGIGMTYIAQVVNNTREKGVKSNLTIFGYIMDSSVILNKQSGNLMVKLKYWPVLPPVSIFVEMLENKQFIMNMSTTKPAFSAQLTGTMLKKDEYQLLLTHRFSRSEFEDFKLKISSVRQLNKLRLRWESKSGREALKNFNTMQKLLDVSLASLVTLGKAAREIAKDTVNYLLTDGMDKLMAVQNKENYAMIEKYSALAAELLEKAKGDLLVQVDRMKNYSAPLVHIFNYIELMVDELLAELSPHVKPFTLDLKKWLSRTVKRYMNISISGITVVDIIREKTQLYYKTVKENVLKQVKICIRKCIEMSSDLKNRTMMAKKAVERFTCNYDLECTQRNVQVQLKKLAGGEIERVFEHLKPFTQKYRKLIKYTMMIVKETRFEEKVLVPTFDLLRTLLHTLRMKFENIVIRSGVMTYYLEMKLQHKEVLKVVGRRVEESKILLKNITADAMAVLKRVLTLVKRLNAMSWKELQVFVKNRIKINYKKLREKIDKVSNSVMEKVMLFLERHANETEELIKCGKIVYMTYKNIMNGNTSAEEVKEKFELLLRKILKYLKQKLRTVETIKLLKLEETATNAYYFAVEMYQNTSDHLWEKVGILYPKVIEELQQLLFRVKTVAVRYMTLVKTKILELRDKQKIYVKKAEAKLMKQEEILVKKAYEVLDSYKNYTFDFGKNMLSVILKLVERYEGKLEQAIAEWKFNLTSFIEKATVELNNNLRRYQDMPIEEIYLDLQLKASCAFDKLVGFIIGKTLFTYEEAMEKIKEMKEFYQMNTVMVIAEWKHLTNVVRYVNETSRQLVVQYYENVIICYEQYIQSIVMACKKALKAFGRDVISLSNIQPWYEQRKYIKFKEFYYDVTDYLAKSYLNPRECCEKGITGFAKVVKKIKGKLKDFIREVKKESKNVIQRIERVNEDVKRDTLETFEPYVKKVKNVLLKHKAKTTKKLASLNEKYEKVMILLVDATEHYVKRLLSSDFIQKGNLSSRILECIHKCFFKKLYSHRMWSVLKQEFLEHELVVGFQKLLSLSVMELKEMSTDYCIFSHTSLLNLRDYARVRLERLGKDLLGNAKFQKIIERIGNMSIHDIESYISLQLNNSLALVKTAYVDLSKFVVAELIILDIWYREGLIEVDALRESLVNVSQNIIKRFKVITIEANVWATRAWANSKYELRKLEYLAVQIFVHLEKHVDYSMSFSWQLIDMCVPYKTILKMTPKQLVGRIEGLIGILIFTEDSYISVRQELEETVRYLYHYTRDNLHFLATEILETTMFVTKFYGSTEIVYSTHLKLVQFANVQLQRLPKSLRVFMANAMKRYNHVRDIVEILFAGARYAYHNKSSEVVKFIKTEIIHYLHTKSIRKVTHKIENLCLNMSSKFLVALERWNNALQNFLKSSRFNFTAKLNESIDILETLLGIKIPREIVEVLKSVRSLYKNTTKLAQNMYSTIFVDSLGSSRTFFNPVRNIMTKNLTGDFIDDIPTLMNNAITYLDMCKNNMTKLMNLTLSKLREKYAGVFLNGKQKYTAMANILKKNIIELNVKVVDVMISVKDEIKDELPVVAEKLLKIINITRKANITFVPGGLELELRSVDEIPKTFFELKTLVASKYVIVHVKLVGLHQSCMNNSEEILEQLINGSKTTLNILSNFCNSSIQVAREEFTRLHQKAQDFYDEIRLIPPNISKKAKKMLSEYWIRLLEENHFILEKMEKIVPALRREIWLKIDKLQSEAMKINDEVVEAMKENRFELIKRIMTHVKPNKIIKYINVYIDVDQLSNKTKEIDLLKDLLSMTLELGNSCYTESLRLVRLFMVSGKFSMYVMKQVWQYKDVWEIVEELTNLFHSWIPTSNSKYILNIFFLIYNHTLYRYCTHSSSVAH